MEEGNTINGINLVKTNAKLSVITEEVRDALPPSFVGAIEKIAEGIDPMDPTGGETIASKNSNN